MMRAIILFLLLLVPLAAAGGLYVEKVLGDDSLEVGGTAVVQLVFNNTFDKPLNAKVIDRNIFGSSGLDIQCLEVNLEPGVTVAEYEPIEMFTPGSFTLAEAHINFTDPGSGVETTISSSTLEVKVDGKKPVSSTESITTIYRCGNVNMKSTQQSSSSQSQNQQEQKPQEPQSLSQQKQSALQNSQMGQNTQQLKEQMQKEAQEQKKLEEEFAGNLSENKDFQQAHQEMLDQGYKPSGSNLDPQSSDTGDFELNYSRDDGETASLKGSMQNGTMENLQKSSSESMKNMMEQLQADQKFNSINSSLSSRGFNRSDPQMTSSQNSTELRVEYEKDGEKQVVRAVFENETLQEVILETDENRSYWWLFLLLLPFGYFIFRRLYPKKIPADKPVLMVEKKPVEFRKIALEMLDMAQEKFDLGEGKSAYGRASSALRFYYRHKLKSGKELTGTELLRLLKSGNLPYAEAKRCLDLCNLVQFARYRTNSKDFGKIMSIARNIIGGKD